MRDGGRGGSLGYLAWCTNDAATRRSGNVLEDQDCDGGGMICERQTADAIRPREIGVEAMSQMKAIPEAFRDAVPRRETECGR